MSNIAGLKVTRSVIVSGIIWLAALLLAFIIVLIGTLSIESKHSGGPGSAMQWYMLFVGGILLLAGLLVTLFEIILGSPLHRLMRAVIILVVGLNLLIRDGMAVLALVAAVGVEAYLLRHGIAKPAESDEPAAPVPTSTPAAQPTTPPAQQP